MNTIPNHIIRELDFDRQIEALGYSSDYLDLLDSGIDWVLSRNAEAGTALPNGYFLWVTEDWWGDHLPPFRILYHLDKAKRTVTLIRIDVAK